MINNKLIDYEDYTLYDNFVAVYEISSFPIPGVTTGPVISTFEDQNNETISVALFSKAALYDAFISPELIENPEQLTISVNCVVTFYKVCEDVLPIACATTFNWIACTFNSTGMGLGEIRLIEFNSSDIQGDEIVRIQSSGPISSFFDENNIYRTFFRTFHQADAMLMSLDSSDAYFENLLNSNLLSPIRTELFNNYTTFLTTPLDGEIIRPNCFREEAAYPVLYCNGIDDESALLGVHLASDSCEQGRDQAMFVKFDQDEINSMMLSLNASNISFAPIFEVCPREEILRSQSTPTALPIFDFNGVWNCSLGEFDRARYRLGQFECRCNCGAIDLECLRVDNISSDCEAEELCYDGQCLNVLDIPTPAPTSTPFTNSPTITIEEDSGNNALVIGLSTGFSIFFIVIFAALGVYVFSIRNVEKKEEVLKNENQGEIAGYVLKEGEGQPQKQKIVKMTNSAETDY